MIKIIAKKRAEAKGEYYKFDNEPFEEYNHNNYNLEKISKIQVTTSYIKDNSKIKQESTESAKKEKEIIKPKDKEEIKPEEKEVIKPEEKEIKRS